jgi:hypothetical protein
MAETHESRRYQGMLEGGGCRFSCVVQTTTRYKTSLPPDHYRTEVISINGQPTDGSYKLHYAGETDDVRVSGGFVVAPSRADGAVKRETTQQAVRMLVARIQSFDR